MTEDEVAVELLRVTKKFGSICAVDSVCWKLPKQATGVIIGPSGSGKTTLLRMIAGLVVADSGMVGVLGDAKCSRPIHERGISLLSQDYALYPQLSVWKNIRTGLISLRLGKREIESRITQALEWFQIEDLRNALPSQISGGQAQRVAFAKAIVRRPRLLLLDEPMSQLDTTLRQQARTLIQEVTEQFNITTILVTHDPIDVLQLGTHALVLDKGRAVQADSPEAVYRSPITARAAELLSPFGLNRISQTELVQLGSDVIGCKITSGQGTPPGSAGKYLAFRPECSQIIADEAEAPTNGITFRGRVTDSRFLGFAWLCRVNCGGKKLSAISERRLPNDIQIQVSIAREDWFEID